MISDDIDQRLEDWADWSRGPSIGGSGSAAGYLRERLDQAHESEMTPEVAITDRAVARTKCEEKAYWRVISRYYLGRLAPIEIAQQFNTSEYGIKNLLAQAKSTVCRHIAVLERIH